MQIVSNQLTANKLQEKIPKVEEILERLRQRDLQLFKRIVDAVLYNDENTSIALATEVVEIRKAMMVIECAGTAVNAYGQRYPDLILCPSCCSPEISISQSNTLSKCHCLECGKKWTVGIKDHSTIESNQFWSVA